MIAETLNSFDLTVDYLVRLVADVPDEMMTRQAQGVVNHPAWTIGHLIYSAQAIGGELGLAAWLPANWQQRFGTGSTPQSSGYETKAELLSMLADARRRLRERLNEVGETALAQPLPDVRYRDTFPTLGHAVVHILAAHWASHVGQLIVWRRAVGLAPLGKVFD
jgi:hypothetical protein